MEGGCSESGTVQDGQDQWDQPVRCGKRMREKNNRRRWLLTFPSAASAARFRSSQYVVTQAGRHKDLEMEAAKEEAEKAKGAAVDTQPDEQMAAA